MNFQDIALPLAERGFRVFPVIPKEKRPFAMAGESDHFDAATTDTGQIQAWSLQAPNANVGISPDEIFCFLETDDERALKDACADLPPEIWDSTRVSARDNRCYYIFRQTMRTKRAGNMTKTREGLENLFEFKQHRLLVTGPGSIHKKTGMPYAVEWRPTPAMPDLLLNRLCELVGSPKGTTGAMSKDVKRETELLDRVLACYEVPTKDDWFNKGKQWYRPIECPWSDQHENTNTGTSTCVVYTEDGGYGFDCKHRCSSNGWKEFRAELERRFPDRKFFGTGTGNAADPGLPPIAHAKLAEAFRLKHDRDFVSVYDAPGRPVAAWVGTRWDILSDDAPMAKAIGCYLDTMAEKYPAPVKGPDARMRLYQADFRRGVLYCVKPELRPIKQERFDADEYLLGLPDTRVIDLRTGTTRDMMREDYITRRIDVAPDPNCPTPRWNRFLSEITLGDEALAGYLVRLGALCLTANPYQGLFFLWGTGRNGKGVYLRVLANILGEGRGGFAMTLNKEDVTNKRFSEDTAKRINVGLKGKRLVYVGEAVGENLNLPMLKVLSGGDSLKGARMRQDAETFKPTHKLLLPSNDRPKLEADPAFRGRVHFIPFRASFLGREDRELETHLKVEYPGILYRWLTLCPDVIANGLRPPAAVLGETSKLFDELDVTKQFLDDCLDVEPGSRTELADMERAVGEWLRESRQPMDHAEKILAELKRQPGIKYERERSGNDWKKRARFYVGVKLR